jgi:short-subunit dehydrogenase
MSWKRIAVIGATSGIARAIAAELARMGTGLVLSGRDVPELERVAADLSVRYGVPTAVEHFDALDFEDHPAFVERCFGVGSGELDGAVICFGTLVPQATLESDSAAARRLVDANFTGAVTVLNELARAFERRGHGIIAVLSSVAGDRGRQSNYVYGAAKAGLSTYCEGLRNRLFHRGVHVLTVKPGFVATAMTRDILDPDSPLVARPERVARDVVRAMQRRRDVVYTPWFWRWILLVIRGIPVAAFKRMRL